MAGRCEDFGGRFPVWPGMTGIILPGRFAFVMADFDRPSGGTEGENVGQTADNPRPGREAFGDLKGGGDVPGLLVHGDAGLGAGAAGPDEEVRPDLGEIPGQARNDGRRGARNDGRRGAGRGGGGAPFVMAGYDRPSFGRARRGGGDTEGVGQGAGEDFGLVVAAGAEAGPVEGDGDDQVDVREVRGGGEAAA